MSSLVFRFAVLGLALVALCACEFQRSADASAAKRKMIGMSKEQVLACMGVPAKKAHVEETEVWNYHSNDGSSSGIGQTHKFGTTDWLSSSAHSRSFCDVNVVMKNDKVSVVHYNGPTGGWMVSDEQCGYAVEHCVNED